MQYIGARYVPKFMGTFDPTQAYENMCVVDNGLGTSYISIQPTPAGTSLTDTTYWALYGASSGAIINLQNQIDNINSEIDDIVGKKYECAVVLGNSYAIGHGSATNDHGVFYHMNGRVFKEGFLYAGSGTGFIDYDGAHTTDTFLTHLDDAINDPLLDNDKVEAIFIIGAYGEDYTYTINSRSVGTTRSLIEPAVNTFMQNAATAFPNLKKVYYINAESRAVNKITHGHVSYIDDNYMVNYIMDPILVRYNIINLGWCGLSILYNTSAFASDEYHPNDLGYEILTNAIINKFNGGSLGFLLYDLAIDCSAFTGVADSVMKGRALLSEDKQQFLIDNITIPAGTLNIGTSFRANPVSSDNVPAFINERRQQERKIVSIIEGHTVVLDCRTYLNDTDMSIQLRSDTALTDVLASNTIIPFSTIL